MRHPLRMTMLVALAVLMAGVFFITGCEDLLNVIEQDEATPTPTASPTPTPTPTPTASPSGPDSWEPGDNELSGATVLLPGTPQTHTLHESSDVDWFVVNTTAGMLYTVTANVTGGDLQWDLVLGLDEDGDGFEDKTGNVNSPVNFYAEVDGTFYVCVSTWDAVGEYTIEVIEETPVGDSYEPDDDSTSATVLEVGSPQTHTLHVPTDVDWFKVNTTTGKVYTVTLSTPDWNLEWDLGMELYEDPMDLPVSYGNPNTPLQYVASSDGVVYVKVATSDAIGEYTIEVTEGEAPQGDSWEPGDDGLAGATELVPGTPQDHTLHTSSDVDWFVVNTSAGMMYTVSVTTSDPALESDIWVGIDYDGDGVEDDWENPFSYTSEAGESFYIKVSTNGAIGAYTIEVMEQEPVPADAYEDPAYDDGTDSENVPTVTLDTPIERTFHLPDDVDMFIFNPTAGTSYTITLSSSDISAFGIGVMDFSTGSPQPVADGEGISLTFTATNSGMHVIAVWSSTGEMGTYQLTVTSP